MEELETRISSLARRERTLCSWEWLDQYPPRTRVLDLRVLDIRRGPLADNHPAKLINSPAQLSNFYSQATDCLTNLSNVSHEQLGARWERRLLFRKRLGCRAASNKPSNS